MQSRIAEELKLRHSPVAVIFTDEKPERAVEFEPGARGCVIGLLTAAARGKTAVLGPETTPAAAEAASASASSSRSARGSSTSWRPMSTVKGKPTSRPPSSCGRS